MPADPCSLSFGPPGSVKECLKTFLIVTPGKVIDSTGICWVGIREVAASYKAAQGSTLHIEEWSSL